MAGEVDAKPGDIVYVPFEVYEQFHPYRIGIFHCDGGDDLSPIPNTAIRDPYEHAVPVEAILRLVAAEEARQMANNELDNSRRWTRLCKERNELQYAIQPDDCATVRAWADTEQARGQG